MRAGSGPSAVRSSSYLDVVESHPEWLGAPFIEEAECLRDTNETAWRWGGHLGEITGTGGAVFDNVHDARLSDSRIRGFERIDFRKNVLGRHEGGPQSLPLSQKGLCLSPVHIAVRVYPPSAPPPIGKAPSQILHAL